MIQTFNANSILNHLSYILQYKKGYKIIVKGRPFRTTRTKKIKISNGYNNTNNFMNAVDYHSTKVRTKYGMCGIKV
jgi:ribosomal protein S3